MEFIVNESPCIDSQFSYQKKGVPTLSFLFSPSLYDCGNKSVVFDWVTALLENYDDHDLVIECKLENLLDDEMSGNELLQNKGTYSKDSEPHFLAIRDDLQRLINKIDAMKFV
jgi:hypothetical protein